MRAVPTAKRGERAITQSGTVAIVGRPNVGKSTLLNAALAVDLAIVSKTPQTTRENLLGVLHRTLQDGTRAELLMLDTPGLHEGKTTLSKRMNRVAKQAASSADVVIVTTEVPKEAKRELSPYAPDVALVRELPQDARVVLVVNKVDRIKDKTQLFPLLEGWTKIRSIRGDRADQRAEEGRRRSDPGRGRQAAARGGAPARRRRPHRSTVALLRRAVRPRAGAQAGVGRGPARDRGHDRRVRGARQGRAHLRYRRTSSETDRRRS